ncbi:PEGA domain-containing protein [Halomontanus rarus]|uniref:PEGA domain-containing protein n=1 Tax=Halomontanus rarus TaxID=3034020 RepID=UPI001A990D3D
MHDSQSQLGRRRILELSGAATLAGLAGCMDGDGGNGDDDEAENGTGDGDGNETDDADDVFGSDDEEILLLFLENEDGDPVSEGVSVTVVPEGNDGMNYRVESQEEMEGGEIEQPLMEPDDYHITVEGEGFEDVEETVTVDEGQTEEVTVTLEGAPAEGEADGETNATDEGEGSGDE